MIKNSISGDRGYTDDARRRTVDWVMLAALLVGTPSLANGAEDFLWTRLSEHPVMVDVWRFTFWTTPVFFLLQLCSLLLLLWKVGFRWRPDRPRARMFERWLLQLGVAVAVAAAVMLFMSCAFEGGYQEQRGHWIFHVHDGLAGLALVPVYILGSIIVGRGITNRTYQLGSGIHLLVLRTLMWVSLWYVLATAGLEMTSDPLVDMSITAIIPAVAAVNYTLLSKDVRRHGRVQPARAREQNRHAQTH